MSETSTTTTASGTAGASTTRARGGGGGGLMAGPLGRNLGLVIALVLLCIAGVVTAGDRFADVDNVLTILRLAAVIGVVSVGMTFVIIGGGIDLSVGALVALSSVWATTLATQQLAEDYHWIIMVVTALLVGSIAGLVNGVVIADGVVVTEAPADALDEHRVLDLVMEGTAAHAGGAAGTTVLGATRSEGDVA